MPNGPEDNGPPTPPGGTRGVRRTGVPAGGAPTRVEVTRTDIATGETQDIHSELLREIKDCCDDQTKTLSKKLDQIKDSILRGGGGGRGGGSGARSDKDLVKLISDEFGAQFKIAITQLKTAPGAVGEAGEAAADLSVSFGATAAATKTAEQRLENLKDILEKTSPQFSKWADLFVKGVGLEFQQTMRTLNASMQSLATTLKRDATRAIKDTFKTGMELARTGLVDLTDVALDTASAIKEQRDNIVLTFQTMQKSLQAGLITPLGTFGITLQETGKTLADLRKGIAGEGFKFEKAFKSVEDINVAMSTLRDLELRAGIKSDIRDSETQQRWANQFENLRLIASISGKQLEEIIAARGKQNKTDAVLIEQGLISYDEAVKATQLQVLLRANNLTAAADALEVLKQNGVFAHGIETGLASMTEQERQLFAQNPELTRTLIDAARKGTPEKAWQTLQDTLAENRFANLAKKAQDIVSNKQASEIFTEFNAIKQIAADDAMSSLRGKEEAEKGRQTLDDVIRGIFLAVESKVAPDLRKLVWTTAGIAGMLAISGIAKLGKFALGKLRGGGAAAAAAAAGGITRGGGGLTRPTMPAVGGRMAGMAGMGARAAGVMGRGAGFLGRLIPGLGTAISGGLAVRSFAEGDILGGLLHGGASVASIFPGIGTAVAAGLEGLALGREFLGPGKAGAPGVSPTPAPTGAVRAAPSSSQKMLLDHMQAQTNFLSRLVALSETSNTIGQEISDRFARPERAAFAREGGTGVGAVPYEPPLT